MRWRFVCIGFRWVYGQNIIQIFYLLFLVCDEYQYGLGIGFFQCCVLCGRIYLGIYYGRKGLKNDALIQIVIEFGKFVYLLRCYKVLWCFIRMLCVNFYQRLGKGNLFLIFIGLFFLSLMLVFKNRVKVGEFLGRVLQFKNFKFDIKEIFLRCFNSYFFIKRIMRC